MSDGAARADEPASAVARRSGGILSNPQRARLATEVRDLGARLDAAGAAPDVELARVYHSLARDAHGRGDVDEGWHFAYRTAEALVRTMDDETLMAEASDLAAEVEAPGKFTTWRAHAIRSHLELVSDPSQSDERRRVEFEAALRVRHMEYENVYRRLGILRRHQAILLIIGTPALLVVLVLVVVQPDWSWIVVASAFIGVVGAVVSAAERSTRLAGSRIPTQLSSTVASLSRIPIGAVAGLTVWLAASATQSGAENVYYVLITGFAAGFSERLVTPKVGGGSTGGATST